jgi:hypothetical protein
MYEAESPKKNIGEESRQKRADLMQNTKPKKISHRC